MENTLGVAKGNGCVEQSYTALAPFFEISPQCKKYAAPITQSQ